ncbi:hypothetical protein RYF04_00310 [Wolbachia endosymbiont of Drosophila tristis]|uniref:hypothetical protein n=1 Tax=Wolbachia endosymbiont of Drosophila tristis TaxID=267696 RepID=UPI0029092618|nr:hypothetical protein [Wolbachia endosymbiont of Drosophila tristis]MDU8919738.1 hypothetical protein [Wolbachia endosymbiont of Drosophila tristis]
MKKKAKEALGLLSALKYWRFLCFKRLKSKIKLLLIATNLRCKLLRNLLSRKKDKESPS